jgi:serine/threonine protein kinase
LVPNSGFTKQFSTPNFSIMEIPEKMARDCLQCATLQPDEWVKGKLVGSGSFGTVHLAMNKATGGLFVVKSAWSGAGLQALQNEAKILESLNSRYVVRCIGRDMLIGSNGEHKLNVFMEYMAGGSLSDVAEKFGGVLEEEVIRLYTREILHGLKYLHENGIVHCDIKCKNVLLCSSGNIKVADFGCAKRIKEIKSNGGVAGSWKSLSGTPLWMAPEVLRNEGLDFASDIWSLGCTVIEMATGRPPWSDEVSNPIAAVMKIACGNERPKFPTQLSKEGVDFLAKCLERDPKKRWTSEELLNHPFVVSGNSMRMQTRKEHTCSPSSILGIGIYDSDDSNDSDDSGSTNLDEFPSKNPFSRCCDERNRTEIEEQVGSDLQASSEIWVTVRSGGSF